MHAQVLGDHVRTVRLCPDAGEQYSVLNDICGLSCLPDGWRRFTGMMNTSGSGRAGEMAFFGEGWLQGQDCLQTLTKQRGLS